MKSISQVTIAVAVVAGLTLGAAATGVAQGKSQAARHTSVARPSNPSTSSPKNSQSFPRGVATKLGTTPEAMETAYATAKQADPKLTRGHFVAANMIAKNLGAKNPAVTTQAILSGLQSGRSIGQTLQSLGVSSAESHEAQRAAAREAKEAESAKP